MSEGIGNTSMSSLFIQIFELTLLCIGNTRSLFKGSFKPINLKSGGHYLPAARKNF